MQYGNIMIEHKYSTHNREPFFEIARNIIPNNGQVLDVGGGDGSFGRFCGLSDLYILEGNPESAEKLKTEFSNTVYGRLPKLPFKDLFFDVIHMSHVIEHLQPQEVYDTLVEFDRCCKPGGALVISAPLLWEGFYDDLSHVKPYGPSIFKRYLCASLGANSSRLKISNAYSVERLVYRYIAKTEFVVFQHSKNKFYNKLKSLFQWFYFSTFQFYEKSGYTIVLRKKAD